MREPARTLSYTLDAVGNRTTESVTNDSAILVSQSTLDYDARDRLTERSDPIQALIITQAWDADGNRTGQTINGETRTFTYDARDRLVTLQQPGAPPLVFDYDSHGLRTKKAQGAAETRYQYDQSSLIAETNAIGNTLSRLHYGATQLLARTEAGSTPSQRHYLLDALNSPIVLTNQAGTISARTKYDAFGEILAQQGTAGQITTPNPNAATAQLITTDQQPIGFTGYQKDEESGLYYAKARYYDPTVARFTTEDPEAGKAERPPSLHRYLYAYANPTVYVDPTGRQSVDSPSFALQQTLNMASNPREREIAQRSIDQYGAAMRARADPDATGVANSFVNGTKATLQLAMDAAYTIPEALLPESADLGSRVRLGAFFQAAAHPIDTFAMGDRMLRYEAAMHRRAGDEFTARATEAEANTNLLTMFLGAKYLIQASVEGASSTIARIANRNAKIEASLGSSISGDLSGFEISRVAEAPDGGVAMQPAASSAQAVNIQSSQFASAAGAEGIAKGAAKSGEFSIVDWNDYPAGVPKPQGPFRLVEGAEYDTARKAANQANNQLRQTNNLRGQPVEVHEVQPVKFGGSPTDLSNKIIIDKALHRQEISPWWGRLQRDLRG